MRRERAAERARDVERIGGARDAEPERRRGAGERQRRAAEAGDEACDEHGDAGLGGPARPCAEPGRGERDEPERGERRERGPSAKRSPPRGSRQREREPGERDRGVEDGEAERDVPEREDGTASAAASPSRARKRGQRRPRRARARRRSRRERTAASAAVQPAKPPASAAAPSRGASVGSGDARCATARRRPRRGSRRRGARDASSRGGRPPRRVERQRTVDERRGAPSAGRGAASRATARPARSRARCRASRPARTDAGPTSASQSITPTAQTSAASLASSPASRSGRDVRERPGHVALRGQRLRLGHPREPEVEEPDRDAVAVGEQHVRRLHVAVEDPGGVGVREPVADLRAGLDRRGVVQLSGAERLAERAARHELVGDVDVARVAAEGVRAQTARVPQPRGGRGLALGARGRLALARRRS